MNSEIKVYSREDGQIQRVQMVKWEDWKQLDFLHLQENPTALKCFRDIYANFLVPGCPWVFGNMILFQVPKDLRSEFPLETKEYGKIDNLLTAAAIALEKGVKIIGGKPVFQNSKVEEFWRKLEKRDSVYIVCGKLPITKVIPIADYAGFLTEKEPDAEMKVNASFFIMDSFDCATVYDHVGKVFGLCVKDGVVISPPLYHREALLVKKNGKVMIKELDIRDLEIKIQDEIFLHGQNVTIYTRPERTKTPKAEKGKKIVIVGKRVVAVKEKGSVPIPASGFVLCLKKDLGGKSNIIPGEEVFYHGLEEIQFGIQVGNSIVKNGVKTEEFISKFYNIRKLEKTPFPPSLYPMDFNNGRAARIALGCDREGKPTLFWAEGAGKIKYIPGEDSTGASLKEMAEIAEDLGMFQAVNLDGGGSAQILLKNERRLRISDRKKEDNSDAERLVPVGLVVRNFKD